MVNNYGSATTGEKYSPIDIITERILVGANLIPPKTPLYSNPNIVSENRDILQTIDDTGRDMVNRGVDFGVETAGKIKQGATELWKTKGMPGYTKPVEASQKIPVDQGITDIDRENYSGMLEKVPNQIIKNPDGTVTNKHDELIKIWKVMDKRR